ncbi:hypothetical protein WAZ07_14750 [Bacillus sp. FJAT-51639]|uniref:Uncharacterized protein n=1 Tax=Bacillus bruguierae TaxID=3127667 RepID=A0ABU8FIN7_9BACI
MVNYNDSYYQMIENKCKEFEVPTDLYAGWIKQKKERDSQAGNKGFTSFVLHQGTFSNGIYFPFFLQKFEEETLETGVIAIKLYLDGTHKILWEYRKFGYPEGALHAEEGKRKYLKSDELQLYINEGYKWLETLSPPILINFSLAEQGIFHSSYEDLK